MVQEATLAADPPILAAPARLDQTYLLVTRILLQGGTRACRRRRRNAAAPNQPVRRVLVQRYAVA